DRLERPGRGGGSVARRRRRRDHGRSRPPRAAAASPARPAAGRPKRRAHRLMVAFAAADLGAQSGRVALGRLDGDVLSLTEVHRFPNVPVRAGGSLQWDILSVYRGVLDGLAAAAELADVRSVAVDSWGVDFGLLDGGGRLLGNPVHYRDG